MHLTGIEAPDFDLATTLNSGQVFHWERIGDGFYGTIGERAVYVEQRGDILKSFWRSARLPEVVARYFALDHPLEEICASFPRDPVWMRRAIFASGLRIIRQPKWECLATFICSSMKQVAHIRQISQALRHDLGKGKKSAEGKCFHFRRPTRWPGRRKASCENAGWVIARKFAGDGEARRGRRSESQAWSALPERNCGSICASFPA